MDGGGLAAGGRGAGRASTVGEELRDSMEGVLALERGVLEDWRSDSAAHVARVVGL